MTTNKKNIKCPRCSSKRLNKRLSGENHCQRCGQRWTNRGLIIPSYDRRKVSDKSRLPKEEQLPLIAS